MDRNRKLNIYEQQGIPYFLLVNTDNETIEIYRLLNGSYELTIFNVQAPFVF